MRTASIAIVGGGLSGLYAAYRLEQRGITDYVLLEARSSLGGRISSPALPGTTTQADKKNRFDLGPSWFWPGFQSELAALIRELGLEWFEQFETGDMMVERSTTEPPFRTRGYANSPPSMRLVGGMESLIEALYRPLDKTRILTGRAVSILRRTESAIDVNSVTTSGQTETWRVQHTLLAVPPRLAEDRITFSPPIPESLAQQWRATPTWMAPHAKYIALYDTPFWREQRLSGEARSLVGPMNEIHDASIPGASAALFGFFGIPAEIRQNAGEQALKAHCRAQFARLFGPAAATPKAEMLKDWSHEPYTATAGDLMSEGTHAEAPAADATSSPWQGCITGIASEWSRQFPGYLAGAIDAVNQALEILPLERVARA